MKKSICFLVIFLFASGICNAQKKSNNNQTVITESQRRQLLLPDLTFTIAYLHAEPAPVPGVPGRMKVKVIYVINNTGNFASRPCTLQAMYSYNGIIHDGGDHGAGNEGRLNVLSNPTSIEAIPVGGKIDRSEVFTFNNTPDLAYGQTTALVLKVNTNNAFKEISATNNQSDEIVLKIPAKKP